MRDLITRRNLILLPLLLLCYLFLFQDLSSTFLPATKISLELSWNGPEEVFRIKHEFNGFCVGVSNDIEVGEVGIVRCDPHLDHTFSFTPDGKLMGNGSCIKEPSDGGSTLRVGSCDDALRFDTLNTTFLSVLQGHDDGSDLCLSVEEPHVFLGPCTEEQSRVILVREAEFQHERRYLKLPPLQNTSYCGFPACSINRPLTPVQLLPPGDVTRCHVMSECVTIVIKTARRPLLVARLARSFKRVKGYDLPIIAIDDGIGPFDDGIMSQLANFTHLRYLIADSPDLGISRGRNIGVELVKTKYFLLFDDDTIVHRGTDIEKLVEILDTTDASLVGGKVAGNKHFAGFFLFGPNHKHPESIHNYRLLTLYSGSCQAVNITVPNHPSCTLCDSTTNVFMAKTRDVLEVGGWTPELKVREHKDLFVRLKAAQKKVVYCPWFTILNRKPLANGHFNTLDNYFTLRQGRHIQMHYRMNNFWNIDHVIQLGAKKFSYDLHNYFPDQLVKYYNSTSAFT